MVFNPVSFWFGYDKDGRLIAVLAEVNNTFGGRHHYFLDNRGEPIPSEQILKADKALQVSPFNEVEGEYEFRFRIVDGRVTRVMIRYLVEGRLKLYTHIQGKVEEWTSRRLIALGLRVPFQTLKVLFLIHYQALKLFLKGVPFVGPQSKNLALKEEL